MLFKMLQVPSMKHIQKPSLRASRPVCCPKALGHSCLNQRNIHFREAKQGPNIVNVRERWTEQGFVSLRQNLLSGILLLRSRNTALTFYKAQKGGLQKWKQLRQYRQNKPRQEIEVCLPSPCRCLNHGPSSGTKIHGVEAWLPEVLTSAYRKALIWET